MARLIFMGSPIFAARALESLASADHEIIAVYTQPPRPAGRGMKMARSEVAIQAEKLGLPLFCPKSLKGAAVQEVFASHRADLAVVAAYGLILPAPILHAPLRGCLNIHASLLPRWRGAAPIERAIEAGDQQSGVSIMLMDEGLDTGPVLCQETVDIVEKETGGSLLHKLTDMGARLIMDSISPYLSGKIVPVPQNEKRATYARKIDKAETQLDFRETAAELERKIRAFMPFRGCWTTLPTLSGRLRVVIEDAEIIQKEYAPSGHFVKPNELTLGCGQDAIRINRLKPAGKPSMHAEDFLRGTRVDWQGCAAAFPESLNHP